MDTHPDAAPGEPGPDAAAPPRVSAVTLAEDVGAGWRH
jgi:hypothetical protein